MKEKTLPILVLLGAVALTLAAAGGADAIQTVIVFLLGAGLYFLPTIAAMRRGVPNQGSITVVNFFLGWTLLGWVIALAMAYRDPSRA